MNSKVSLNLVVIVLVGVISGCANVESDWQNGSSQNTFAAYETFLSKYPNSMYQREAEQRIELLKYQEAISRDEVAWYLKFMDTYPKSTYTANIEAKLNEKKIYLKKLPAVGSINLTFDPPIDASLENKLAEPLRQVLRHHGFTLASDRSADVTVRIGELIGTAPAGSIATFTLAPGQLALSESPVYYWVPIGIKHRDGGAICTDKKIRSKTVSGAMWGGSAEKERLTSLIENLDQEIDGCLRTYFSISSK